MNARMKPIAAAVAAAASLTLLAACSADTTTAAVEATTDPSAQSSTQPSDMPQGAPGPGGDRMMGTFGLIAEVQGSTLQVQGDDGQTAVTFTDATTFTAQTTGTIDAVQVGLCVSGTGSTDDESTATQLTVTEPVDGACQGFGGAMGGGMGLPDGEDGERTPPSGAPSAMPSDMPSGGPVDGGQFGAFFSGLVTAVDGSTVTVESTDSESTTTTFTVADDAAITATTTGTSDDAVAGLCALAQGDTDSTGAVTATSIQLSEATDGECSFGGGMR